MISRTVPKRVSDATTGEANKIRASHVSNLRGKWKREKPLHRSSVNYLLKTANATASLPFAAHPHMLRHACGFTLADQGADTRLIQYYLGHRKAVRSAAEFFCLYPAFMTGLFGRP
jgi:integrase